MGTGQVLNPVRAVGIERKEGRGRGHSRKRAGDWPGRSGDTVKRELLVSESFGKHNQALSTRQGFNMTSVTS